MIDAADVITEARRWIGTPFRHQGYRIGHGCDCVGFIRGVAENLGLVQIPEDMERDIGTYSRMPNPRHMGEKIGRFLERAEISPRNTAPDGYIAWIGWRPDMPMHLAITSTFRERRTLIHALAIVGKVSEHGFTDEWRKQVHSYWRLPNVRY